MSPSRLGRAAGLSVAYKMRAVARAPTSPLNRAWEFSADRIGRPGEGDSSDDDPFSVVAAVKALGV